MDGETGVVIGMGRGADGQLGLSSRLDITLPRIIHSLAHVRVKEISCGMAHTGVVTDTGTLLMFGKGKYGRLGTGTETDQDCPAPVLVGTDQRVTAVACGGFHTAVLTAKGSMFTFGRGDSGQLGHETPESSLIPRLVSFQQKVAKIACGVDHTICCTAQGLLYGFGSNSEGQLGIGALSEFCSKPQRITYPESPTSSSAYPSAIACGHCFSGIILDGNVLMWGLNEKGQCGNGTEARVLAPSTVHFKETVFATSLSCGLDHTIITTETGQAYTWGSCEYGQLGIASELLSITNSNSVGANKNFVSTPYCVKEALLHESAVAGCCGSYHSVVLTVDGKLYSWGLGDKGQLGKGVEGSGVAPYPYHMRFKNIGSKSADGPRIATFAAGGRQTIAVSYCKPHISVATSVFAADMERLYATVSASSASFFDVIITVDNGTQTFDAHRIFLSRSPTLLGLLANTNDSGASIATLNFPKVTRDSMAVVLRYLYTNQGPSTTTDASYLPEACELAKSWELFDLCALLQNQTGSKDECATLSLSRHLKKFIDSPEFSDVSFSFVSEEDNTNTVIRAHKAVLVARCEFFSLEFMGNFKESTLSVITIPDTSSAAFLQFLSFLYSDEISFHSELVELLSMSNMYQLVRLKNLCEQAISTEVDFDNAATLYEITQQCEAKQLEDFCNYFIITQYDRVSKTDDFKMKFMANKQQAFSDQHANWEARKKTSPSSQDGRKCTVQ